MSMKVARIPSAYQEVEWVGFTGNCLIDTGITPTYHSYCYLNFSTKIQNPTEGARYYMLYTGDGGDHARYNESITYTASDGIKLYIYIDTASGEEFAKYGSSGNVLNNFVKNESRCLLITDSYKITKQVTLNGANRSTNTPVGSMHPAPDSHLMITNVCGDSNFYWRCHHMGYANRATMLYEVYLVPCYRKADNVIGFYDKVSHTFFTHSGTGTLDKGADVVGLEVTSITIPEGDVKAISINGEEIWSQAEESA